MRKSGRIVHTIVTDELLRAFTINDSRALDLVVGYHNDRKLQCFVCRSKIENKPFQVVSQSTIPTKTLTFTILCTTCIEPIQNGINEAYASRERAETT